MADSQKLPGYLAYALARNLTTGIEDKKMAKSVTDSKVLASKTFNHSDSIRSGPVTVTLYSSFDILFVRSDGYETALVFSLIVSEEDQLLFFNEVSNASSYERFKYDKQKDVHLSTVHFAHFLIEQKIPKSLAVRLALVVNEIENGEELFASYRNLKQAFFYNQKTGLSSFEIYLLLATQYSAQFADSVFKVRGLSLDALSETYDRLKSVKPHADAKERISVTTPESLETFIVLARFMDMNRKQNALVTARLVVDDGTTDWNLVTLLNERMKSDLSIEDLIDPNDLIYADYFRTKETRNRLMAGIYGVPGSEYLVTIFALLIAKYGVRPIVQAINKLREDRLTENSFAAFIVIADFIGQTGDTDTNLQWILLLSGDMDEDNFQ